MIMEWKKQKLNIKSERAITLVSLVTTIVILIILAGIAINLSLGNNGIFNKAKEAKEETNKQTATEKINLKITTVQMNKYAEEQVMPSLKELSEVLRDDNEIEYVTEKSQIASTKYEVGENPNSIFTKLQKYPYEFEIDSSLKLASINGVKIGNSNNYCSIAPEGKPQILDEDFTLGELHTITAPDEGWIRLSAIPYGIGGKWYSLAVGELSISGGASAYQNYINVLPCKKGQKVQYNVWGENLRGILEFIPMQ